MPVPEWVFHRVNSIIWPFLWGSNIESVARSTFFVPILDGGIGLVNLPLKCASLRASSLVSCVESSGDKSFFLCRYFAGWRMARLHSQWAFLRNISFPFSFKATSFYSSCLSVLSRVDLNYAPLSARYIYRCLLTSQAPLPRLHRAWTPFLGPGFSLKEHWAKVRDLGDNRFNDLFWLIALRGIKVRDSLRTWGYINSDRCATCNLKETIDHCFLNCRRVKRVWAHFRPMLSALLGLNFSVSLLTVFFFVFPCDPKRGFIARFIIKTVCFSVWFFRNKSTFHNGREDASALVKFALHSIKGRVKADFHRLPRGRFDQTWVVPGFVHVQDDVVCFLF